MAVSGGPKDFEIIFYEFNFATETFEFANSITTHGAAVRQIIEISNTRDLLVVTVETRFFLYSFYEKGRRYGEMDAKNFLHLAGEISAITEIVIETSVENDSTNFVVTAHLGGVFLFIKISKDNEKTG